jgi:hypothetical protein
MLTFSPFSVFQLPVFMKGCNYWAVICLLLMYGWAMTPLMYLASFLFVDAANSYIVMVVVNLFIGITTVFTSFLLQVGLR